MLAAVLALRLLDLVLETAELADRFSGVPLHDFYLRAGLALDDHLILEVVLRGQMKRIVGVTYDECERRVLHIIIM